jgi:hypothetical protein
MEVARRLLFQLAVQRRHSESCNRTSRPPSNDPFPCSSRYSQNRTTGLSFTARIGRAQFHRARSASEEATWPFPPNPSEAARCTSTKGCLVALPLFPSSNTLKSRRPNQAMPRDRIASRGKELVLSGAEQRNKPFLFEVPICRQGL